MFMATLQARKLWQLAQGRKQRLVVLWTKLTQPGQCGGTFGGTLASGTDRWIGFVRVSEED